MDKPPMIYALYSRHHSTQRKEFDTLRTAAEFLSAGGEVGSLLPLGIYDSIRRELCLPSLEIPGVSLLESAMQAARAVGFEDDDAIVHFRDLVREGRI